MDISEHGILSNLAYAQTQVRSNGTTFYCAVPRVFIYFQFVFKLKWQLRRVWRNQRVNQNPYSEEEQTTQWPKERGQKDKQRSTKHTHKTKDWVTRTPLKTGRVISSCSTSGTRRVNLVTNPVISRDWGKDREVLTKSGTYPWSFVTHW